MKHMGYKLRFLFLILLLAALPASALSQSPVTKEKLVFFFSQSCNNCHEVKEGILSLVSRDYRDRIAIEYLDIADIENYKLLLGIRKKLNLSSGIQVPAVYFGNQLLIGQNNIENTLLSLIRQPAAGVLPAGSSNQVPAVDLLKHFMSFTPVAVIAAGLIDGINPCAFTVIIFFISFLSLQGYPRKELFLIGISFIFAVFLTYLLLGLGLFNFFYSLNGVLFLRKLLNAAVGLFTFFLGILAVRDIVIFAKTGSTENMILQLPDVIKRQIHKVIGVAYRKPSVAAQPAVASSFITVCVTALATGFLVSLLEAVCTGQVYLPTITFVLKNSAFRLQAAGYLVLYNAMFIIPLAVIFLFALAGVSSGEFAKFMHRHFLLTKSLLAAMFFVLSVFLLWRG